MSVAIGVTFSNRIEIATDTALIDPTTQLFQREERKIHALGYRAAVMVRGYTDVTFRLMTALHSLFVNAATVDEAVAALRASLARSRGKRATDERTMFEASLFALSEAHGPRIFWFQNGGSHPGREPWHLYETSDGIYASEFMPPWMADAVRKSGTLSDKAAYLMNRTRPASVDEAGNHHQGIGGSIDHTVIDEAGITTRRIYEWRCDSVGQPLTPSPQIDEEHQRGRRIFEAASPIPLDA